MLTHIALFGTFSDTQFIAEQVRAKLEAYALTQGRAPSTRVAAHVARNLVYRNKDHLHADVICAGADGGVYAIPQGGALLQQPLCLSGSGAACITGFLDANYEADMAEETCVACVEQALRLAVASDAASGGGIVLCVLKTEGGEASWRVQASDGQANGRSTGGDGAGANSANAPQWLKSKSRKATAYRP